MKPIDVPFKRHAKNMTVTLDMVQSYIEKNIPDFSVKIKNEK